MTNTAQLKCTHILHENGIHEFSLVDASASSYEAYMQELDKIYQLRTLESPPMLTLFESTRFNLPISFSM
jgi:hypothetical protein